MREGKTYREHLAYLNEKFNGKMIIKWCEVIELMGQGKDWCNTNIPVSHNGCTVVELAMALEHRSK